LGCLFVLMAGFFPRIAFLVFWIARPAVVNAAFDTVIWPLLGLIFLPFTTLMYTLLWTPGIGVTGFDWVWIGIAVALDIGHYAGSAYANRDRIPGYTGSTLT
jgi:hypothetical protein